MEVDNALQLLGRYSKWQLKNFVLVSAGFCIPFAWMTMSVVFIGDSPPHRCEVPPNATLNQTIPFSVSDSGDLKYSSCERYIDVDVSNETEACSDGYWYDPEYGYDSTIVTEWNLVCGKGWLVELSMTIGHIGASIGAVIFTRLGDIYGRKPVFIYCLWTNCIISIIQAFSPNYEMYTVLAFIDGFQQQGMLTVCCVLAVELFPTPQRTFPLNAIEFFWVFGYISIVPLAYFIRNWRWFQFAITIPMALTVSYYWILDESIPWLVANDKRKEAEKLMREAFKLNGKSYPDEPVFLDSERLLEENDNVISDKGVTSRRKLDFVSEKKSLEDAPQVAVVNKDYGVIDIFKSPVLLRYSLAGFYIFFTNGLAYYALSYTVTYIPGDRYVNTCLYALLEVPAYIVAWVLMAKVGRRLPLIIFHFIGGTALILTMIQNFDFYTPSLQPLMITLSLIGKFGLTITFATVYVIVPELYPTNVRNTGLGMASFFSKLATIVSPFSRTLYRTTPWLPPVIMGGLAVLAGFVSILLPETHTTSLPESIEEVEEWSKQKTSKI